MIKNKPLVSICIPTYKSALMLESCLKSIQNQSYQSIEIIIVDADSHDATREIANKYHVAKFLKSKKALLGARNLGVKKAKGIYTLLLDSDQILGKDTLISAVRLFKNFDMLILEESVYEIKTLLQKLINFDKKLIHSVSNIDPVRGAVLPRFYKTSLLLEAFTHIGVDIIENVGGQDHAIIYYEAWQLSQKVGILKNAVEHQEPKSFLTLWRKMYRWGYTSKDAHYGKYKLFLSKKENFRTGLFRKGLVKASLASMFLLIFKGIPYKLGHLQARLNL